MTPYENPGIFAQMFGPGDLVFDVGACEGKFTKWYLERGARVVAVEPEARNVGTLWGRFGNDDRVTIVNKALGREAGFLDLAICGASRTISSFVHEHFWGPESPFAGTKVNWTQRVEVTTLDALVAEHGCPQFVKVDVEGYEPWVLRGLSAPVPFVQFEFGYVTIRRGWARQAVGHVLSLAPHATFNYTVDESNSFALGEDRLRDWFPAWVVLREMDEKLAAQPPFWGNVFANMTEDCDERRLAAGVGAVADVQAHGGDGVYGPQPGRAPEVP